MKNFFSNIVGQKFEESHFADATLADLTSIMVARGKTEMSDAMKSVMDEHNYSLSPEFYQFILKLQMAKATSTRITPSTMVSRSLLTGSIREATPTSVKVVSPQGEIAEYSSGSIPTSLPMRANLTQMVSLAWGLTKVEVGVVVPKYTTTEIKAYGWKSLKLTAPQSMSVILNEEFPRIGTESGKKMSISDARYVDKLTEEYNKMPLLLYYALVHTVITKVLDIGTVNKEGAFILPPWMTTQTGATVILAKIPEAEVRRAYEKNDHETSFTLAQVTSKKMLVLIKPIPLKQLQPANLNNSFSAYQSVVQGQAIRKGDDAFLLGSGTSGMPTRDESNQTLLLSFIKAFKVSLTITGVEPHTVLSLIKSLSGKQGIKFVLLEADYMAIPLSYRRTYCTKSRTAESDAISLYVSFKTMPHSLMGQLKDQTSVTAASNAIDEHFSEVEDLCRSYNYVMMCAVLPTASTLAAYDLRMAYDGFGLFSMAGREPAMCSIVQKVETLEPLQRKNASQWNTFVYDSNRVANTIFLSPIHWSRYGRSNILQGTLTKETTMEWSEDSFSASYGARQDLLESDTEQYFNSPTSSNSSSSVSTQGRIAPQVTTSVQVQHGKQGRGRGQPQHSEQQLTKKKNYVQVQQGAVAKKEETVVAQAPVVIATNHDKQPPVQVEKIEKGPPAAVPSENLTVGSQAVVEVGEAPADIFG